MNGTEHSVNQSRYVVSFFSVVRIWLLSDGSDDGSDGGGGDGGGGSMCKIACKIHTEDRQAAEEDSWRWMPNI